MELICNVCIMECWSPNSRCVTMNLSGDVMTGPSSDAIRAIGTDTIVMEINGSDVNRCKLWYAVTFVNGSALCATHVFIR